MSPLSSCAQSWTNPRPGMNPDVLNVCEMFEVIAYSNGGDFPVSVRFNPAGWSDRSRTNHSATIPADSRTDHLAKGSKADFPSSSFIMGFLHSFALQNHHILAGFQFPPDHTPSSTLASPPVYSKTSSKLCKKYESQGRFPFFLVFFYGAMQVPRRHPYLIFVFLANLKKLARNSRTQNY